VIVLPFPIPSGAVGVSASEAALGAAGMILDRKELPEGGNGVQVRLRAMAKAGGANGTIALALGVFRDDGHIEILDGTRLVHAAETWAKLASGWADVSFETELLTLVLVGRASLFAGTIRAPTIMLRERSS
jgi:hypothetical protein